MKEFTEKFYPMKAKAEQTAEMMNQTGIDHFRFTLETKPSMTNGQFSPGKQVYKCAIWKEEEK